MKNLLILLAVSVVGLLTLGVLIPSQVTYADMPALSRCADGTSSFNCESEQNGELAPAEECSGTSNCIVKPQDFVWTVYLLNLVIETIVASVFVLMLKKSKRLILAVIVVNLISWPLFFLATKDVETTWFIALAEVVVWLFEAGGIYLLCRKQTTLKFATGLSALTNASTIAISLLLSQL